MIYCCGVDEVGFGAGAAQLYVSACMLDPGYPIEGLRDSKKLTPKKREILAKEIKEHALCWFIAQASLEEIEKFNIKNATLLAMKRAVEGLAIKPQKVYVDGIYLPDIDVEAEAVVRGDDIIPQISAASILAKVARDQRMREYHKEYPQYGFDKNKGYLTKAHLEALKEHGPCPIHRKTYQPIRDLLIHGSRGTV